MVKYHNFTTSKIQSELALSKKQTKKIIFLKIFEKQVEEQKKLEKKYIDSYQSCPKKKEINDVTVKLSNLNPIKLLEIVKTNFYSSEVLKATGCIISAIMNDNRNFQLSGNERTTELITDMHYIAKGANGLALIGSLQNSESIKAKDFFIVKTSLNSLSSDEIQHECAVALMALNKLREFVPNFAYIYCEKKCSSVFVDERTKKVISWCNTDKNPISYAFYENITPAITFRKFTLENDSYKFMKCYLQLLLALGIAITEYGFTHYDCHDENVLIRIVSDESIYIPYGEQFIQSDGVITTLIDYGMSHIQLKNSKGEMIHYGDINSPNYGVSRDNCCQIFDAYKLLCFSLRSLREKLLKKPTPEMQKCYDDLCPLLRFFNEKESYEDIIDKQRDMYYCLPQTDEVLNIRLYDYINFCRQHVINLGFKDPIVKEVPKGGKILQCQFECPTISSELKEVGIDLNKSKIPIPQSYIDFYDIYENMELTDSQVTTIYNKFDLIIDDLYDKEITEIDKLITNIKPIVIYRLPINFNSFNPYMKLFDDNILKEMQKYLTKCVKFFDSYKKVLLRINAGKYIQEIYQIPEDVEYSLTYNKYLKILEQSEKIKQNILKNLYKDIEILEPWEYYNDKQTKKLKELKLKLLDEKGNKKYVWYWENYPKILDMV